MRMRFVCLGIVFSLGEESVEVLSNATREEAGES
jgi:hypothetical protein